MLLQNLGHVKEHQVWVLSVRRAVVGNSEYIVALASDVNLRTVEECPTSIREAEYTCKAFYLSTTSLLFEMVGQILIGITLIVVLFRTQPQVCQVTSTIANLVGNNLQLIVA